MPTRLCAVRGIAHPLIDAPVAGAAVGLAPSRESAGRISCTSRFGWGVRTDRPLGVGLESSVSDIAELLAVAIADESRRSATPSSTPPHTSPRRMRPGSGTGAAWQPS